MYANWKMLLKQFKTRRNETPTACWTVCDAGYFAIYQGKTLVLLRVFNETKFMLNLSSFIAYDSVASQG